jgi:hypothetical protein
MTRAVPSGVPVKVAVMISPCSALIEDHSFPKLALARSRSLTAVRELDKLTHGRTQLVARLIALRCSASTARL